MKRLAILGASGHGKVVAEAALLSGWSDVEFFDSAWPALTINGVWPVRGGEAELMAGVTDYDGVVIAIGNNSIRRNKQVELMSVNASIATIIHPAAVVSQHAVIGSGSVIFATAVVNAFSHIGDGAILNTGCSVDHDCSLGNYVHVSPGARLAGGVQVDDESWIGIGACVRQLIKIGSSAVIGAGAAVVSDISDNVTVVGVPARPIA